MNRMVGVLVVEANLISPPSFRDAPLGAGPESILTIVVMDSGLALRAPRNDGGGCGAHLRILAAHFARGLISTLPSSIVEGAGKTGCALHPRSRVQCARRNAHTSIQVQRRASGLPCAMALRLMARSPRRRIRLVTVASGLAVLRNPVWLAKPPPT